MAAFSVVARGTSENDGTGDPIRDAFGKVNDNFAIAGNTEEINTWDKAQTFTLGNTYNGNDTHNGNDTFEGANTFNGNNTFNEFISVGTPDTVTISSGSLTVTKSYHSVNGEGGAADNLDTITGTYPNGTILILKKLNASGTITITESGNIRLEGTTKTLTTQGDRIMLQRDVTAGIWVMLSYSAI